LIKRGTGKTTALLLSALYITLPAIGIGCSNEGESSVTNAVISEITYHYGDASVPPDYHRSYSITVTLHNARVTVDSYGDILANKAYKITPEQFNNIRKSLEKNKIRNCRLSGEDGCTGGTSESISYSDEEKELFSGCVYHCRKIDTGNLCGDIERFANDVKRIVPNLDKLVQ
jgi:hypothetical protein